MECITSVSYSLLVNDEPSGLIRPTRGIRQGDPLSPYIFIICMEVLSNSLLKESLKSKSKIGIKLCSGSERIPCVHFADDCLLFWKADTKSCGQVKRLWDDFCRLSGQLINFQKSTLTFSNNANTTHRQLAGGTFNVNHSDSVGRYLGCPLFQNKPNRTTFHELLKKAMSKMDGWKANCARLGARYLSNRI